MVVEAVVDLAPGDAQGEPAREPVPADRGEPNANKAGPNIGGAEPNVAVGAGS